MKELCLEERKELVDDEIKRLSNKVNNLQLLMNGVRQHLDTLGDRINANAVETSRVGERVRVLKDKIEEEIKDVRAEISKNQDG